MPKKTPQSFANFIWLCHSNRGFIYKPKNIHLIPHPRMLQFNQYIRKLCVPFGDKLQRADPGHYQIEPNF